MHTTECDSTTYKADYNIVNLPDVLIHIDIICWTLSRTKSGTSNSELQR